MAPIAHPGRLLKRELNARALSANRLALDLGVPSGRITDILNGRRSITADTAVRLGRYFGNSPQFWVDLQGQYDIAVVEPRHRLGLPVESAHGLRRGGDVPEHDLEGERAAHRDVFGAVDVAHRAASQALDESVAVAEDGAEEGIHLGRAHFGAVLRTPRHSPRELGAAV